MASAPDPPNTSGNTSSEVNTGDMEERGIGRGKH